MTRRTTQLCLGAAALIAALCALSIPYPTAQKWEYQAVLRLVLLSALSVAVIVLLSLAPRTGRWLGLLLAIGALAQLITSVVGLLHSGGNSDPSAVTVGLAPWVLAVVAGMILLFRRETERPNT